MFTTVCLFVVFGCFLFNHFMHERRHKSEARYIAALKMAQEARLQLRDDFIDMLIDEFTRAAKKQDSDEHRLMFEDVARGIMHNSPKQYEDLVEKRFRDLMNKK